METNYYRCQNCPFHLQYYQTIHQETAMSCPKYKAKIGTMIQQFITDSGAVSGILCYICGCWIQAYPQHAEMPR